MLVSISEEESVSIFSLAFESDCSGSPKMNSSESSASEIFVGKSTIGKVSDFSTLRFASFPKASISCANFFNCFKPGISLILPHN